MRPFFAAAGIGFLLSACAVIARTNVPSPPTAATRIGTLTLSDSGCTLERSGGPTRTGAISLSVFNRTQGVVEVSFGRLADGFSFEDFSAFIRRAREVAEAGGPMVRNDGNFLGPSVLQLPPGGSSTLNSTVATGTYAIVCFRLYPVGHRPYDYAGPLEVR